MLTLLDELNPEQRLAVESVEGPVLILAGAGTGKTRAITYRMANLIANRVPAEAILAVTFTNKAAEEMRNRVRDLLLRAGVPPAQPWLSTFHSLCARLLRREAAAAGLPRDFAIYDDDDQIAAVKLAMAKLQIEENGLTPRNVLSRISYAKNQAQTPEQVRAAAFDQDGRKTADIFTAYEKLLHDSKALDFDDLLLRSARLLRESTATRDKWQARFHYIHVDEYQDTNRVQYELMRLLTGPKQNVCVVGDEDQSIYRWRGADVSILLSFSRDFPTARVVKLERNYRSTQNILDAAGAVVANNPERLGKSLSAEKGGGTNLKYFEARDAQAEAEYVAGELERIQNDDSDQTCAVEYRTNFQSRALEEVFRRRGLRYKLVGGFSFYNRAEVKDALAYVRMAMHPEDDISLLRVLNVPPRGIGKTTVDALRESARVDETPLWAAIEKFVTGASTGRAVTPLRAFQELIQKLQEALSTKEPAEFLHAVLEESGYMDMLKDRNTPEDVARMENLEELTRAVAESMEAGETFTDFLDAAALVSDADQYDGKPGVTLITLHSTKGLEFDHVFLTGMEEGICPHSRSISEEKGIEEERRLVYVGMTRARKSLTVTRAVYRRTFGNEQQLRASLPSRFLAEIPSELVDTVRGSMAEIGETRRYEPDPEYSYSSEEFLRRVRGGQKPAAAAPRRTASSGSFGRPAAKRGADANPMLGRKVRHPSYGVGTIVGVEGDDEDRRVSVSFPGRGTKKFIERYAQLEQA
ncbi:MAG TPA: UvrD-helicase domain-containing protein [Candidatus Acidoferrum sp.]|jgi:DNA helicase-2/ATP-dependent DNA helicase PcrA|nr:UvrD-helicase domain-containing protein [Candidatus Acidoferrum sp.]